VPRRCGSPGWPGRGSRPRPLPAWASRWPPARLVHAPHRADGLPLVVEDLVALDGAPGPLRHAEIGARRLDRLDPAARHAVDEAAVLGDDIDTGLVGAISGLDPAQVVARPPR